MWTHVLVSELLASLLHFLHPWSFTLALYSYIHFLLNSICIYIYIRPLDTWMTGYCYVWFTYTRTIKPKWGALLLYMLLLEQRRSWLSPKSWSSSHPLEFLNNPIFKSGLKASFLNMLLTDCLRFAIRLSLLQ